jgi:hypothetical protein
MDLEIQEAEAPGREQGEKINKERRSSSNFDAPWPFRAHPTSREPEKTTEITSRETSKTSTPRRVICS